MTTLLSVGLANAVVAAGLALLAAAAGRFSKRPALAHSLWLLVLIKLITPPLFWLPVAALPATEPAAVAQAFAPPPAPSAATPVPEERMILPAEDVPPATAA